MVTPQNTHVNSYLRLLFSRVTELTVMVPGQKGETDCNMGCGLQTNARPAAGEALVAPVGRTCVTVTAFPGEKLRGDVRGEMPQRCDISSFQRPRKGTNYEDNGI